VLRSIRERLTLVLIALLPFHALMVTAVTRLIAGPDHAPLSWLALWKEGVLGVIILCAAIEYVSAILVKTKNKQPATRNSSIDILDWLIGALLILSLLVTAATHANWTLYIFGFRYDFVPLVAFLVLRRVSWSDVFLKQVMNVLLIAGGVVAAYGILTFFVPSEFFHWLGYSDLHSLYVPDRPIAAFQQIGGTTLRRIQGPMSGPNHLGLWLLIPMGVVLAHTLGGKHLPSKNYPLALLFVLCGIALLMTFSRTAWIAAFVMTAVALYPLVRTLSQRVFISLSAFVLCLVAVLAFLFPSVIVRISSSRGHLHGPIEAVEQMLQFPLGKGMGMAGPASNRVSETCVLLLENDDPTWWQENRPDMCVFTGNTQVQPVDRACSCPFLPENWFLQIGVEMGWLGLGLYLWMMGVVFMRLRESRIMNQESRKEGLIIHNSLFLILLSLCVAALLLHAFEDSAVAYTLWILMAACAGMFPRNTQIEP